MTPERLFNSFIPPPPQILFFRRGWQKNKTNFWLRPWFTIRGSLYTICHIIMHMHNLEIMTSHEKSDFVSRWIFTWKAILPHFTPIRFKTTCFFRFPALCFKNVDNACHLARAHSRYRHDIQTSMFLCVFNTQGVQTYIRQTANLNFVDRHISCRNHFSIRAYPSENRKRTRYANILEPSLQTGLMQCRLQAVSLYDTSMSLMSDC